MNASAADSDDFNAPIDEQEHRTPNFPATYVKQGSGYEIICRTNC